MPKLPNTILEENKSNKNGPVYAGFLYTAMKVFPVRNDSVDREDLLTALTDNTFDGHAPNTHNYTSFDIELINNSEGIREVEEPYRYGRNTISFDRNVKYETPWPILDIYKAQNINEYRIKYVLVLDNDKAGLKLYYGIEDTVLCSYKDMTIMSHGALAYPDYPVAGGEFFFDENRKLIAINNASGHLLPDKSTLLLVVQQILIDNLLTTNDKISIHDPSNFSCSNKHNLTNEMIEKSITEKSLNFEKIYACYSNLIKIKAGEIFAEDKNRPLGFFRRTAINDQMSLSELINHAQKKPSCRTAKAMGLLNLSGLTIDREYNQFLHQETSSSPSILS